MPTKPTKIQRMVRAQIAAAIEHDLNGGESLMKEVYENLPGETSAQFKESVEECEAEMRAIVTWLRRPDADVNDRSQQ